MSQVWIDQDAINNTHACLSAMSQDIQHRAAQHNQLVGDIERALSNAWGAMTHILDPAHALTEGDVWGRFGFDGLLMRYLEIRDSVEQFHSTATTSLTQLCQAHAGQIGADFAEHAARIQGHLTNAHGGLWNVSGLLSPGSIIWLASNAWELVNPLQSVYGEMVGAAAAMTAFMHVLDEVVAEVQRLLRQLDGAPASPSGSAGTTHAAPVVVPIGVEPLRPGTSGVASEPFTDADIAQTAKRYAGYLYVGDSYDEQVWKDGKPLFDSNGNPVMAKVYDRLNVGLIPAAELQRIEAALTMSTTWSKNRIECVTFVYMVLAAQGIPIKDLPVASGDKGNAGNWLNVFDGHTQTGWHVTRYNYTQQNPTTTFNTNPPQVGDIFVMSGGDGHVAVVTGVSGNTISLANANGGHALTQATIQPNGTMTGWGELKPAGFIHFDPSALAGQQ